MCRWEEFRQQWKEGRNISEGCAQRRKEGRVKQKDVEKGIAKEGLKKQVNRLKVWMVGGGGNGKVSCSAKTPQSLRFTMV